MYIYWNQLPPTGAAAHHKKCWNNYRVTNSWCSARSCPQCCVLCPPPDSSHQRSRGLAELIKALSISAMGLRMDNNTVQVNCHRPQTKHCPLQAPQVSLLWCPGGWVCNPWSQLSTEWKPSVSTCCPQWYNAQGLIVHTHHFSAGTLKALHVTSAMMGSAQMMSQWSLGEG